MYQGKFIAAEGKRMKLAQMIFTVSALVLVSGCAASQSGPSATLKLESLEVASTLKAGVPYNVSMPYEEIGEGSIAVAKGCFTWSGEGPYCFDVTDDFDAKIITAKLRTRNPNKYELGAYVEYVSGGQSKKSNTVSAPINVKKN